MTHRQSLLLLSIAVVGACSSSSELDESLKRDLGLVEGSSANGLELAPQSRPTQVVSTIEGGPTATPAPSPQRTRRSIAPRPKIQAPAVEAPAVQAPRVPASVEEPEVEAPAALPAVSPTPRPTSAPQGAGPAPAGGWKTIDQIAPKLPFPIKP